VVIDALDVAAVGEIVKLILETAGYVLGGLRPKLLRSIGQGIFKDADGMGDHIAPGAALTLAVKTQIPMQAIRWSSWVATPIRYGLAKAAPERFTPIPEKPARQMQPGGAEPPPRSPAPMPDPSATLEAPGLEVGSG
jgi:hypothetical protein